jgi:hypothetical protein
MPTLSSKLKVAEVYAEWERIEEALRPIGVPVDWICFLEQAIDSLAYGAVERARALGIEAYLHTLDPVYPEEWLGKPVDIKLSYHLPDETQAVLFRTMVL